MKTIVAGKNETYMAEAVEKFKAAKNPVALTGAGISVNSGIADFRSPGGLWSVFSPEEYATLEVFLHQPEKAWQLFRELGTCLIDKKPNIGHQALVHLEENGFLKGLITQNVDNLHQIAGNKNILEIHGDHQHLHCLQCGNTIQATEKHFCMEQIPLCNLCDYPLKPNIVLFGEAVKSLEKIEQLIVQCDLLLVIGTSANVHPAAGLPIIVHQRGGIIYEFNRDQALSSPGYHHSIPLTHYFFQGDLSSTLPKFTQAVLKNEIG
jgi:NAD-dependent deacetylase